MTEIVQPGVLQHKPRRRIKPLDVIVAIIVIAVLIFLGIHLVRSISLKNEVAGAKVVSDKVVTAIANQDANAARGLGDTTFKSKNSAAQLSQVFTNVSKLASGTPTVVKRTVDNSGKNDTVYILYKYSGKTPYYIRVGTAKESGKWYLANIAGSTTESSLVIK